MMSPPCFMPVADFGQNSFHSITEFQNDSVEQISDTISSGPDVILFSFFHDLHQPFRRRFWLSASRLLHIFDRPGDL